MTSFLVVSIALGAVGYGIWRYIQQLDGEQKRAIKDRMVGIFDWAENKGYFPRAPAYVTDFHADYPEIKLLEDNYATVRKECEQLLGMKERIADVAALSGGYTDGGIHAIEWKSFMFKSGAFLESNCRLAPETTKILRKIPDLYTAFFSILEPKQYVTPHFGYYKGFLRYHLGVIIPGNNVDRKAWLRVNADKDDNDNVDHSLVDVDPRLVEAAEKYYWHDAEGVMFDDTFVHDAANESDAVRVVLWLDVARKMPWWLHAINKFFLDIVHRDESIKIIRKNATIA
jgi:aspartyl/asparaginyl beta-hydroxylase (cupin superfamily)